MMDPACADPDPKEKIVPLTLHAPMDQIEWLAERADRQGVSVYEVVRALLAEARRGEEKEAEATPSSPSEQDDDHNTLDQLRGAKAKLDALCEPEERAMNPPPTRHSLHVPPFWENEEDGLPSDPPTVPDDNQSKHERAPVPDAREAPPPSMFEFVENRDSPSGES